MAGTAWAHAGGLDAHAAQKRKQFRALRDEAGAGNGRCERRGADLRRMPGGAPAGAARCSPLLQSPQRRAELTRPRSPPKPTPKC